MDVILRVLVPLHYEQKIPLSRGLRQVKEPFVVRTKRSLNISRHLFTELNDLEYEMVIRSGRCASASAAQSCSMITVRV